MSADTSSPAKQEFSSFAKELQWSQKLHAGAILLVPFAGVCALIACAVVVPIAFVNWVVFIVMYFLTMVVGITVGYHRMLAHRSFKAPPAIRCFIAVCGCMAAQGTPSYWVSNHRRHHQYSDKAGDPHSPVCDSELSLGRWKGFTHSHFGWMFTHELTPTTRYAKDLLQDRLLGRISSLYWWWVYLGILAPGVFVYLWTASPLQAGIAILLAGLTRLCLALHVTSAINSLCHMFGGRPHATRDSSGNLTWLAVLSGGESWHNNHHAFPHSAKFGHSWWQLDLGFIFIFLLEKAGLAWDVKRPA